MIRIVFISLFSIGLLKGQTGSPADTLVSNTDIARYCMVELENYYKARNREKSSKFLALESSLKHSLYQNDQEVKDKLIEELIAARQQDQKKLIKNIIAVFTIVLLGIIVMFLYKEKRYKSRINQKKRLIEEHQKKISDKEIQNYYLNKKNENLAKEIGNEKFLKLIDLAKSNNPEFLVLFSELYPNLIFRLKELNPRIRNSELSFCALAYLNFATKDIAEYTFVAIATVHSRKNRFRKKYNIPSDEDFNVWMRELGDK